MKDLISNEKQTMSSLEIAKLTGKSHDNVLRDIRKILAEAEIDVLKFEDSYKSAQNKDVTCFNLPRRECDLVIAGYSVKYRLAIIDRWQELEAKQQPSALTKLEWIRLALEQEEQLQRLTGENQNLHLAIDNIFGYCSILRAAQFVGVHESTFNWKGLKSKAICLHLPPKKVPSPRFEYQLLYPIQAFVEGGREADDPPAVCVVYGAIGARVI
jgi:Rha family phage regulatory protein